MNRNDIVSICRTAARHLKVLWKGFLRALVGAGTAGTVALAIYGYVMIPTEDGYVAVTEFLVATLMLIFALLCMYAMGGRTKAVRR